MSKWNVFSDNDTGPNDDGFWEWWEVIDAEDQYLGKETRVFKCDSEEDAKWLAEILNKNAPCSE